MPTAMSPAAEQGGARQGDVRVVPREGDDADAVQLLLQVGADDRARADAVDVDATRLGDGRRRGGEGVAVELLGGLLDGARVGEGDLGDDVVDGVARADVGAVAAHRARLGRLLGEGEAQLRVARQPEAPAEAQHRRLGRARRRGELADGQPGGAARVGEDDVGDAVLGGRQRGLDPPQADEQRCARGACGGRGPVLGPGHGPTLRRRGRASRQPSAVKASGVFSPSSRTPPAPWTRMPSTATPRPR